MQKTKVLAFDFGASSGRAMLFEFDGSKLDITEMHRFSNDPVTVNGHFYWDILRLFHEIKQGILATVNSGHGDFEAIGIDTWGVDFGLFDKQGNLLGNPYHYRDSRTDGMIELADKLVGKKYIFDRTGIQFNFFNTLFQLMAMVKEHNSQLDMAERALFVPDIFNYFLTGVMKNEYTEASTSQLLDPVARTWDAELMDKLDIPANLFGEIVMPGETVGELSDEICEELGCRKVPVIAVGSHDTASAVASVPAGDYNYAYISSGTWALMGIEADAPIVNDIAFKYNFTNEGGVCDKIRFLKNIMGLWIIQESRRQWKREGREFSFDDLENAAWNAEPLKYFIDPDAPDFAPPGNMPRRIADFCERTGQGRPQGEGDIIRCAAQSIALKCAMTVKALEEVEGKPIEAIHMVGGGIKDKMVCQFIANATGKRVIAGPVEATSTGNALIQLMALGKISDIAQARAIVKASFPMTEYQPQEQAEWTAAYERFSDFAKMNG